MSLIVADVNLSGDTPTLWKLKTAKTTDPAAVGYGIVVYWFRK